jgi:cellulose synthase/poly-beta-1,6-N-acetylglucosamine synthase-like glycosyltransferase
MFDGIWIDISGKNLLMTILVLAYATTWVVQMIYFWAIYLRLGIYKSSVNQNETKPVSIVIAARNEYHNLIRNLHLILEQDYPSFEVVVVNDASDDESEEYLQTLSRKYSHLNVINIRSNLNFFKGKKFPLALGIKAAKNEFLLLTDADCHPASPNWISEMQNNFNDKTQFVLGYGAYETGKGLLNRLVRWDAMHVAMQYFSFALLGQPYMGVGRNLAYRKSLFTEKKGFTSHYQISGGDDDIFVNQNANHHNTNICISPEARTYSIQARNFSEWFQQKRRHLSTAPYYKTRHKFLLMLWSFTQMLFFVLGIFLLCNTYNILPVASLLILRLMSQLIVIKKSMICLQEKKLLLFSPAFEMFFIIIQPVLALTNIFKREHKWK